MTELQLYKFIQEYYIETRWDDNQLTTWIPFHCLQEFTEMIGYEMLSDGGLEANLQYACVAFDLNEVCEWFDIDAENIEPKEK